MITVYKKNETDFSSNGLGIVSLLSCEVIEELNGIYELTATTLSYGKNSNYLVNDNIIKVPLPKNYQLFRIYYIEKEVNGDIVSFRAKHIFYDLLKRNVNPINITNKSLQEIGNEILNNTDIVTLFKIFTSSNLSSSFKKENKNAVNCIIGDESLLSIFNMEIYRDNFNITIDEAIGNDLGYIIRYGVNLTGMQYIESFEKVITRIKPVGFYEDDTPLYLQEIYVDSDYIDDIGVYTQSIEYSDLKVGQEFEEKILTVSSIRKIMKQRVIELFANGVDKPYVTLEVDFILLTDTTKYKDINILQELYLGDIVTVIHNKNNINTKLQVIRIEYDCLTQRYIKIELGQPLTQLSNIVQILENINSDNTNNVVTLAESIRFDNTDTSLLSTNVQDTLVELNSIILELKKTVDNLKK